jgi:S-adenosylmethionine:tRNA ribosyltransferase-isomerase
VEGLFLHEPEPGTWELMLTESRRLRPGESLALGASQQQLRLTANHGAGIWRAQPVPAGNAYTILHQYGRPPLPPYIKRSEPGALATGWVEGGTGDERRTEGQRDSWTGEQRDEETRRQGDKGTTNQDESPESDAERYQTIYARQPGAVAAPTAGLHFTPQVFGALATAGIETAFVTLHVGVGTFAPIRCEDLADHPMHAEWHECPESTVAAVNAARAEGRKIVAVGTTSVRVLETCADETGRLHAGAGWTRMFIYPPYRFKAVDVMLTNFHLPGSTLLAMVFAFAGREAILTAYEEAIRQEYRFYSYGDAMLIL